MKTLSIVSKYLIISSALLFVGCDDMTVSTGDGSDKVKGISDNMAAALNNLNDACVECKRQTSIAWASG